MGASAGPRARPAPGGEAEEGRRGRRGFWGGGVLARRHKPGRSPGGGGAPRKEKASLSGGGASPFAEALPVQRQGGGAHKKCGRGSFALQSNVCVWIDGQKNIETDRC